MPKPGAQVPAGAATPLGVPLNVPVTILPTPLTPPTDQQANPSPIAGAPMNVPIPVGAASPPPAPVIAPNTGNRTNGG